MRAQQRGFGLLEAVVALAIAAISLAVLYRVTGQSSRVAVMLSDRVQAQVVAESVLASALYADDVLQAPEGEMDGWRWRAQLEPVAVQWSEVPDAPTWGQGLNVARVTVELAQVADPQRTASFTTFKPYRVKPAG